MHSFPLATPLNRVTDRQTDRRKDERTEERADGWREREGGERENKMFAFSRKRLSFFKKGGARGLCGKDDVTSSFVCPLLLPVIPFLKGVMKRK